MRTIEIKFMAEEDQEAINRITSLSQKGWRYRESYFLDGYSTWILEKPGWWNKFKKLLP